jgi:serine/threonine-protein kinase
MLMPADPQRPKPGYWSGQTLGDYLILEQIGAGAMGTVYLAKHLTLNRPAAAKFLSAEYSANPEYVARFLREARGAAQLNHPNVVSVYEAGRVENNAY